MENPNGRLQSERAGPDQRRQNEGVQSQGVQKSIILEQRRELQNWRFRLLMERLLLNEPGRRTKLIYEDGRPIILMEQNADPITKQAHELARETPSRQLGSQNHRRHIAEIPAIIYHDLVQRFGLPRHNPRDWAAWFNNAENAAFRVHPGRV